MELVRVMVQVLEQERVKIVMIPQAMNMIHMFLIKLIPIQELEKELEVGRAQVKEVVRELEKELGLVQEQGMVLEQGPVEGKG